MSAGRGDCQFAAFAGPVGWRRRKLDNQSGHDRVGISQARSKKKQGPPCGIPSLEPQSLVPPVVEPPRGSANISRNQPSCSSTRSSPQGRARRGSWLPHSCTPHPWQACNPSAHGPEAGAIGLIVLPSPSPSYGYALENRTTHRPTGEPSSKPLLTPYPRQPCTAVLHPRESRAVERRKALGEGAATCMRRPPRNPYNADCDRVSTAVRPTASDICPLNSWDPLLTC